MQGAPEADWLDASVPEPMLDRLAGRISERKLRLFNAGCWRRVAEGLSPSPELFAMIEAQTAVAESAGRAVASLDSITDATIQAAQAATRFAESAPTEALAQGVLARERRYQADLLRDIIGNPYRAPVIDPQQRPWNHPEVVALAVRIYQHEQFDRLAELIRLLEREGCTDPLVLGHPAVPVRHSRGCWVLDGILGKR